MPLDAVPLRVGYVLKRFPRLSETFILNEILELERAGVEVTIFCVLKPNECRFHPQVAELKAKAHYLEDLDGRRWHQWLSDEWATLSRFGPRLWDVLRESFERADTEHFSEVWWGAWIAAQSHKTGIHHLHSHFGTMSSTVAWMASRISGIPFSFTTHAKDIFTYSMADHRLRDKLLAADPVITVTEFNKRYLLEQAPEVPSDNIRVIHNGIDLQCFRPDVDGEREDDLIVSIGRLIGKKGFDDLLEACAHLKRRGVRFRCVLVGDGPEGPMLEQKRQILGLEKDVVLAGAMTQVRLLDLMRRATVLALACKVDADNDRDALPTVLLEAMACGLPVVSTAISGIPEIVDDGVDGFLVPSEHPAALADRIADVLAGSDLRRRFATSGVEKVRRKFDLRVNTRTLLDTFRTSRTRPTMRRETDRDRTRVLYLCADPGLPFGGTKGGSVHVRDFVEALAAGGCDPVVVTAERDRGSTYAPDYPVYALPRGLARTAGDHHDRNVQTTTQTEGFRSQAVQQLLAEIHRESRFDLMYERYALFGTGGRMFAQKHGLPYILEVNAPLIQESAQYRGLEEVDLARDVERYLFSTADRVIAVSDEIRSYVLSVAPHARVHVVPNGVALERFATRGGGPEWRARLSADPQHELLVGFFGRVRPWHGVDLLIEALPALADLPIRLCIVGTCDDLRGALEDRAGALGVMNRVNFVDPVSPDVVPVYMQSMDVLVAPYPKLAQFYFSPLKVFEYMAAGRPIVAATIGQVAKILKHEHTALLVPPGDVASLAAAIRRACRDSRFAAQLGNEARSEARRCHGWTHRMQALHGIFAALTAKPAPEAVEKYADQV